MSSPEHSLYLHGYLAHVAPFLNQAGVTDIYINRPCEIWVERFGEPARKTSAPDLTIDTLYGLLRQIAAYSAQGISREHPILTASLPTGERIQAIIPPATREGIAIAIRKHTSAPLKLEDFFQSARVRTNEQQGVVASSIDKDETASRLSPWHSLRHAVRSRKNIIVSGGTSTGKTTFLNALLKEIPVDERLLLIEDTPELNIEHENAVSLIAARGSMREAQIDTNDLLTASLRMRPDRIILGELRGNEAVTFLRAINTGHPGSMTTIHSDTAESAFEQLAFLALQAGLLLKWPELLSYIRSSIDISIHLDRSRSAPIIKYLPRPPQ